MKSFSLAPCQQTSLLFAGKRQHMLLSPVVKEVTLLSILLLADKKMSAEVAAAADEVCASCGTVAVDDVKLKTCACNLVKYCSVDCQKNHRPQHKKLCRKRVAELRDNDLFTQPDESHMGDCPICCLPLPLEPEKSDTPPCCSKTICNGCSYANCRREFEEGQDQRCVFCREPVVKSQEEADKRRIKRMKNNCPVAMAFIGRERYDEGDYDGALLVKGSCIG